MISTTSSYLIAGNTLIEAQVASWSWQTYGAVRPGKAGQWLSITSGRTLERST